MRTETTSIAVGKVRRVPLWIGTLAAAMMLCTGDLFVSAGNAVLKIQLPAQ